MKCVVSAPFVGQMKSEWLEPALNLKLLLLCGLVLHLGRPSLKTGPEAPVILIIPRHKEGTTN